MVIMDKKKRKLEKQAKNDGSLIKKSKSSVDVVEVADKNIKSINKNTVVFDIKHFRKELSTQSAQAVGLTQFLQACTRSESSTNYISLYLESGGNATEILSQLNEENKKNPLIVAPAFSIFNLIIANVQTSAPQLLQAVEEACRFFLNSYVSTIESMISEKATVKHQRITLKLLTAIVKLNPELGFTVLNQLSLQPKTLHHLVKRQGLKEKDDVRTTFIHFVLAFLMEGNTTLIKALLEKQGLLPLIIPDLIRDSHETVIVVLHLLKNNVINTLNISKTVKIRTFNQNAIMHIFNLFNWKGIPSDRDKENTKEHKITVEEAVHDFLLTLCTSHKYGIYFTDKTLGTGELTTSQYLWKAIETLQAPWNNDRAGNLIIQMVISCPDLHRPVIHLVEQAFEPQNSEQWFKTVNFMKSLLIGLSSKQVVCLMFEMTPIQITNFVRNVFLPIPILKSSVNALNGIDNAIRNEIVLLLHTMLTSIKSYLNLLEIDVNFNNTVSHTLKSRLEVFIPKHFPPTDVLISALHSILDDTHEKVVTNDIFQLPLPDKSRILINILNLLLLYSDIRPNSLDPISTMLDSKRLFDKMESIGESDCEELKLKVTKFLLCADKFAFAPGKPLFKDIMLSMFEVFVIQGSSISNEAREVLYNILETTNIFENNKKEIDLILFIVHDIGRKHGKSISQVIVEVIENIIMFNEEYVAIVSSTSEVKSDNLERDFNIIFDNLESNFQDNEELSFIQGKSCLTHFLVGLLKFGQVESENILEEFQNIFVIHILHSLESPTQLWNILSMFKMNKSVLKYVNGWQKKPMSVSNKLFDDGGVFYNLSQILNSDEKGDMNIIFIWEETTINVNGVKGPIGHSFEILSWFNLILFHINQQSVLQSLNETRILNATSAMHTIFDRVLLNEFHGIKILLEMVENCLSHPIFLQNFTPFIKEKKTVQSLLTEFILNLINYCDQKKIDRHLVDLLLRPYKHKIFLSLMSQIKESKNSKKGPIFDKLDDVLLKIKLLGSDAKTITSEILKLDIVCMISDENEASSWISVLCHIINQFNGGLYKLSIDHIKSICLLYAKMITSLELVINITDLEESLYNFLLLNPEFIETIPINVFDATFCVKHVSKYTSKLGALFLRSNCNFVPKFNRHVVKDDVIGKRELVIPLALAAFNHSRFDCNIDIIQKIYTNYKSNIQKIIEKPHKASQIYIDNSDLIVKLIYKCMESTECNNFIKKVHKFDTIEIFHIDILETLFFKGSINNENVFNPTHLDSYLLNILQLATIALKKDIPLPEKLQRISLSIETILLWCFNDEKIMHFENDPFKKVRESGVWQSFFKSILKLYLKTGSKNSPEGIETQCTDTSLFGLTSSLIYLVYPKDHSDIETFFEMTTAHSEFLNVMLSNRYKKVKAELLKLLSVMIHKNNKVMKSNHIPVFLSAYHATRSSSDQVILHLLHYYESSGLSMVEFQPYLWGDIAANHYAVRSKRSKSSLWSNPTVNHLLNLLDKDMIEKTIKYFPTDAKLQQNSDYLNEEIKKLPSINLNVSGVIDDNLHESYTIRGNENAASKQLNLMNYVTFKTKMYRHKFALKEMNRSEFMSKTLDEWAPEDVYDPAFLLPLLTFVVAPGSEVSCHRLVRGGVLALPLAALSSNCPLIRAAAYNVLHRFCSHLEGEMYYKNDKLLWSQFFETLKSSLVSAIPASEDDQKILNVPNPKLTGLGALYLARAAIIMTHPLDPMFRPINNFIISKQYIDFSVVPDFLDLFHNTDVHFIERRQWLLKLLRDGCKTFSDVKVLLKGVTFKMLFDFYSCSLSDMKVKIMILLVINSAIRIPKAAKILTEGYGLLPWLSNSFRNLHIDSKNLVTASINIISNLWFSLALDTHSKIIEMNNCDVVEIVLNRSFRLSDTVQREILCLLLDLSEKLAGVTKNTVKVYLNIFRKIHKNIIKNATESQILRLIKECEFLLKNQKYCKILFYGIENKKINVLLASQIVLNSLNSEEEDCTILNYLFEIVIWWLS